MKKYLIYLTCMIIVAIIFFTSCEKSVKIGGYVSSYHTEEPISGVRIGLYEYIHDSKVIDLSVTGWNDFRLVKEGTTDDKGKFFMEVNENIDLISMYLFLKPSTDTMDINSRYYFIDNDKTFKRGGWGLNNNIKLFPSGKVFIDVSNIQCGDTIEVVARNTSYILTRNKLQGYPDYSCLFLEPGQYHTVGLYRISSGKRVFLENKVFYVEHENNNNNNNNNLIFRNILPRIVHVELNGSL